MNQIYKVIKRIIESGTYDKDDIQKKLDIYLAYNRITQEQYEELVAMMNKQV